MTDPRGIRNNNPLNIKRGETAWRGLSSAQRDDVYCTFDLPEDGIRAAAKILQTYQERHGIAMLAGVIQRWAPPADGNDTSAYITAVEIWADIDANAALDLSDYDTAYALLRAMCRFENGKPPEDRDPAWYPPAVWEKGLRMAGLAPNKTLTSSRTMQGTATAGAGITAAIGVLTDTFGLPPEVASLLPAALTSLSDQAVAAVVLGIALAGALYAAWARRDDQSKGRL